MILIKIRKIIIIIIKIINKEIIIIIISIMKNLIIKKMDIEIKDINKLLKRYLEKN